MIFRKHVKKHHLSNVVHKCEKCDYVARDYSHLKEHILAKHEGIYSLSIYEIYLCNYLSMSLSIYFLYYLF